MTRVAARSAGALVARREGARLSPVERLERELSETAFADQIIDLAAALGWRSLVIRPARTKHGWVTPVAGDGKGWPDVFLLRPRDRRIVVAELKREVGGVLSPEQRDWLDAWRCLETPLDFDAADVANPFHRREPSVEVFVWRPSDLRDPIEDSVIGRALR